MEIRRFRPKDEIKDLVRKAVEDIDPKYYSEEEKRHLEDVIPEMNLNFALKERYSYFVAIEQEEILGIVGYQNESGTVSGIFVKPEFKGRGLGSILMDEIERDARLEGLDEMITLASLEAVDFYRKNGYYAVKEKKQNIEGMDIGIKVMSKSL